MTSREEFEAAWADVMRGDEPPPGNKPLRSQINPDEYRGSAVNFAWKWWQRSRESLVVELPKIVNSDWACTADECAVMRDAIMFCRQKIHAAGVKTK